MFSYLFFFFLQDAIKQISSFLDMSASLTPSKRPHERTLTEPNGKGKWQKSTGSYSHNQPLKLSPNGAVFRVLCPASKIGSVIGKAGSIISEIRQETGAKVKVEEIVSGCEERVIVITSSEKGNDINAEQSKDGSEEANVDEKHDEPKEQRNSEDMGSLPVEHLKSEYEAPPAQKALLLTFDRMVEGEPDTDGGDEEGNKSLSCILRLLVLSTQVGCLLGKGGSVIKQMSSESGAQIRILPRDKLPPCASASDELVQVIMVFGLHFVLTVKFTWALLTSYYVFVNILGDWYELYLVGLVKC